MDGNKRTGHAAMEVFLVLAEAEILKTLRRVKGKARIKNLFA